MVQLQQYSSLLTREYDFQLFWTKYVWTTIKVEDTYQNLKGKKYKNSISLQDRDEINEIQISSD